MPRTIDWEKTTGDEWSEVRLDPPRHGRMEVTSDELREMAAHDGGAPTSALWPQFSNRRAPWEGTPTERAARYDAAHAWLSANATGPWLWDEDWENHGHSVSLTVYVERAKDQAAFAAAHGDVVTFREAEESHLAALAVARGVLPPLGPEQSLLAWERANAGFQHEFSTMDEFAIRITHAGMREAFERDWAGRHDVLEGIRGPTHVVVTGGDLREVVRWMGDNVPLGNMRGGPTPDGYKVSVEVRYPDVAAEFRRVWGHAFPEDDGRTFVGDQYPYAPRRELPEDFRSYLAGDRENYRAPHARTTAWAGRGVASLTSRLPPTGRDRLEEGDVPQAATPALASGLMTRLAEEGSGDPGATSRVASVVTASLMRHLGHADGAEALLSVAAGDVRPSRGREG